MTDYRHPLRFGLSLDPGADRLGEMLDLATAAEDAGLDLLAVQDHPLPPRTPRRADAAGRTRLGDEHDRARHRRGRSAAAATHAAREGRTSLAVVTGGRIDLGVGGDGIPEAITSMGARWADVAAALAPHGLAISAGDHGNVGVGGLATAGGIGWLVRDHGLTIDHVHAADLVLADGTPVRAEAGDELLWALRGAAAGWASCSRSRSRPPRPAR